MATLYLNTFIDYGCKGYHNASSWQIALDPEFTQLVDSSMDDQVNLVSWNTPLLHPGGSGAYADLDNLYARIKLHIDDTISPWYDLNIGNQTDQTITVTEEDGTTTTYNSIEMGLQDGGNTIEYLRDKYNEIILDNNSDYIITTEY